MVGSARQYRITTLLGEGAFGSVYRAEAVGGGLERTVAIKVLHPERAAIPGLVRRLRDEARMLSLIRHRSIVRVDDLVELNGSWSVVMEYVEGADLAQVITHETMPPRVAVTVCEEVANALHAAYNQTGPDGSPLHLVHRDIKPSNLRLTADGSVKLLDFGIARAEFSSREAATTNTGFGTMIYMAPERLNGEDRHAGDIYALGITLFELIIGVPPGKHAMDPDRRPPGKTMKEQWAWMERECPDLLKLVLAMTAMDADERPTARECARSLGDLAGRLSGDRLDDWSERVMPVVMSYQRAVTSERDLTGSIIVERNGGKAQTTIPPTEGKPRRRAGTAKWIPLAMAGALAIAAGAVVTVGLGWALLPRSEPAFVTPAPAPTPHAAPPVSSAAIETMAAAPSAATPSTATPSGSPSPSAPEIVRPAKPAAKLSETKASASHLPSAAEAAPSRPAPAAPVAAAVSTCGKVVIKGDSAKFSVTGSEACGGGWQAGTAAVLVTFPSGAETRLSGVPIPAGGTTTLVCSEKFANCRVER